jgi:hypothetical protein
MYGCKKMLVLSGNLLVMENSLGTPTHASIIFWQTAGLLIIVGYLVHSVDLKKILFQNT